MLLTFFSYKLSNAIYKYLFIAYQLIHFWAVLLTDSAPIVEGDMFTLSISPLKCIIKSRMLRMSENYVCVSCKFRIDVLDLEQVRQLNNFKKVNGERYLKSLQKYI